MWGCRTPPTVDVAIPPDMDEMYQQVRDELRIETALGACNSGSMVGIIAQRPQERRRSHVISACHSGPENEL